jgi:hypothetical protein
MLFLEAAEEWSSLKSIYAVRRNTTIKGEKSNVTIHGIAVALFIFRLTRTARLCYTVVSDYNNHSSHDFIARRKE